MVDSVLLLVDKYWHKKFFFSLALQNVCMLMQHLFIFFLHFILNFGIGLGLFGYSLVFSRLCCCFVVVIISWNTHTHTQKNIYIGRQKTQVAEKWHQGE